MAATNPKELQKFLDLWTPVLSALPAVINSLERAEELQRSVMTLQSQADAAQEATAKALADRKTGLDVLAAELEELAAKKREQAIAVKVHEKACAERIAQATAEAEAKISAALSESSTRIDVANAAAVAVESQLNAKLAAAEQVFDAAIADKNRQLNDLEARRTAAEQALEAIKAKLN